MANRIDDKNPAVEGKSTTDEILAQLMAQNGETPGTSGGLPIGGLLGHDTAVASEPTILSNVAQPVATASSPVAANAAAHAGGIAGFLGKLDPTMLLLGGLSLLGGNPSPFQKRNSFSGTGADPVNSLEHNNAEVDTLLQQLTHKTPTQLRPLGRDNQVNPVSVPGLGIQIGGGLGHDPAMPIEAGADFSNMPTLAGNGSAVPRGDVPVRRRNP